MARTHVDLAKPFAPLDEYSGIPLPILPVPAPPQDLTTRPYLEEFCRMDEHHAFFPNEDFTTEPERVLRHSRLQYGGRWAHGKYHELYQGVKYPTNLRGQFRVAILAAAGYIPDEAVDVRENRPERVELSPAQQQLIRGRIHTEERISDRTGLDINRSHRGIFFMQYALSQDFASLGIEATLEEYLSTADDRRRLRLGFRIFDMAFERAGDDFVDLYSIARRQGNIPHYQPETPRKLVRRVVHGHQQNYFPKLTRRILESIAA